MCWFLLGYGCFLIYQKPPVTSFTCKISVCILTKAKGPIRFLCICMFIKYVSLKDDLFSLIFTSLHKSRCHFAYVLLVQSVHDIKDCINFIISSCGSKSIISRLQFKPCFSYCHCWSSFSTCFIAYIST